MTAAPAGSDRAADAAPAPLTLTADDLRAWLDAAAPGERFVYFTGLFLVPKMPVVREAARLREAGAIITAQQRREDRRFDYLAIKRRHADGSLRGSPIHANRGSLSRASVGGASGRGGEKGQASEESDCLMAILRRLASRGEICPTNARLAEMALLKDAESVRYRMGLLQQCGRIDVATNAAGVRVVTIVASGRSTRS